MKIYHGSTKVVETPQIMQSERMLDFGAGFYTTTNREQAVRWAQRVSARRGTNAQFITEYELDLPAAEKELSLIRFGYPNEAWLDFVCANRSGREPNTSYDLVLGPVADDTVYAVVQFYENGVYNKEEAIKRLKVEKLYNQILFHTEKALGFCKYIGFEALEDR